MRRDHLLSNLSLIYQSMLLERNVSEIVALHANSFGLQEFIDSVCITYGIQGEHGLMGFSNYVLEEPMTPTVGEEIKYVLVHDLKMYDHTEPLILRYAHYCNPDERITRQVFGSDPITDSYGYTDIVHYFENDLEKNL